MAPFGLALGLAVFTKQPAIAALPIVLVWSCLQGANKKLVASSIVYAAAGLTPLALWLAYYAISGRYEVVHNIVLGELVHRTPPSLTSPGLCCSPPSGYHQ
jgi:4-amino-4-deoxy-L-arabinose transferase-like glycosyltransferase